MPSYALTCRECGHTFEVFLRRLLHESDKVCEKCGSKQVKSGLGGGILGRGTSSSSCGGSGFGGSGFS